MAELFASLEKGKILLDLKKFEKAEIALQDAFAVDPYYWEVVYHLCWVKICLNKIDEALSLNDYMLENFEVNSDSLRLRYTILIEMDENIEAEKVIADALNMEPEEANHWKSLAYIYLQKNDEIKSIAYASKGLEIDPTSVDCLNYKALALSRYGNMEEAKKVIRESLRLAPDEATTLAFAGWVLISSHEIFNDYQKARRFFLNALSLDPSLELAKEGLSHTIPEGNVKPNLITFIFFVSFVLLLFIQFIFLGGNDMIWLVSDLVILVIGIVGCIIAYRIYK
jgi:tetratricopeptide (TPR) repeat protein